MQILLASSSIYRKTLLDRLGLDYLCDIPNIDETPLPNETPHALASRLSFEKARALSGRHPQSLIIGSDQVAVLDGEILGKPGSAERAEKQLQQASGKCIEFLTGLCLYQSQDDSYQLDVIPYQVFFRRLTAKQVRRYVALEQPLDCAGSFKWEKIGIALFKKMQGDDVTALEGLPLIRLVDMLSQAGVSIL
ncbi:MAG: Maf family nucleotide pyrophosphatase [Pseudomonadales bacterium]|nr:Maf family nucleotide pyrophosphatase [Pseudomonadales bacterium]